MINSVDVILFEFRSTSVPKATVEIIPFDSHSTSVPKATVEIEQHPFDLSVPFLRLFLVRFWNIIQKMYENDIPVSLRGNHVIYFISDMTFTSFEFHSISVPKAILIEME